MFDDEWVKTARRYVADKNRAPRKTLQLAAAFVALFDLRDLCFFSGLAIAAYGGSRLSGPWTCVVIGAVLVVKASTPTKSTGVS